MKTKGGRRIKIPHVRFGRRVFTSFEAILRWAQAVAEADEESDEPKPVVRPPASRSAPKGSRSRAVRIAAAEAKLRELGV